MTMLAYLGVDSIITNDPALGRGTIDQISLGGSSVANASPA